MRTLLLATVIFALLGVFASPGAAQTCPEAEDITEPLADLFNEVRKADNQARAQIISNEMWSLWAKAPDEWSQSMLDSGMSKRTSYDFLGALEDFDRLVSYCPAYAEGYNQRAFVNFLRQDFEAALDDLDKAISLSPTHVAAISGRALTLMGLGRIEAARDDMLRAVALNPWIPERGLLERGAPLADPSEDI